MSEKEEVKVLKPVSLRLDSNLKSLLEQIGENTKRNLSQEIQVAIHNRIVQFFKDNKEIEPVCAFDKKVRN